MKKWTGRIWQEGVPSSDGRLIERGAITWATPLPMVLRAAPPEDRVVGLVSSIEVQEDGVVMGWGEVEDEILDGHEERDVAMTAMFSEYRVRPDGVRCVTEGRAIDLTVLSPDMEGAWDTRIWLDDDGQ